MGAGARPGERFRAVSFPLGCGCTGSLGLALVLLHQTGHITKTIQLGGHRAERGLGGKVLAADWPGNEVAEGGTGSLGF